MKSFFASLVAAAIFSVRSGAIPAPSAALLTQAVSFAEALPATATQAIVPLESHILDTRAMEASNCGTVMPLYSVTGHNGNTDRLLTTDASELERALQSGSYGGSAVIAYVYSNATARNIPGTVPLYRLYSAAGTDHYLTASWPEVESAASKGYAYEGVVGFAHGTAACGAVPLYRTFQPDAQVHLFTTSVGQRDNAVNTRGYFDEGITAYAFAP
ncbi:hypothetical protein C8Q76DRAFT_715498 [Earliella scabrosa]|nr:hypothetical protein C8Q76DRAFT_715498 [Earliella scabrosa]